MYVRNWERFYSRQPLPSRFEARSCSLAGFLVAVQYISFPSVLLRCQWHPKKLHLFMDRSSATYEAVRIDLIRRVISSRCVDRVCLRIGNVMMVNVMQCHNVNLDILIVGPDIVIHRSQSQYS